jgi:mRNA-degrading endonuclease RelE of RelBE toxin-antitoxin system
MLKTLHIHPRVEKNLEQMNALDNAPKIAAKRAEAVIQALKNGIIMARAGRLSKTKDARIKRLFKYDLGKGFRLISLKDKSALYILFVGSHDQCDTWLDTNSKGKPHQTEVPMVCYEIAQKKQWQTGPAPPSPANPEEDLCDRMPPVSQKDLREVFSGLVRSVQAH